MKNDKNKTAFQLGIIHDDRIGNKIFAVGVAIIFIALNNREQSLRQTNVSQSADAFYSYNFQKSLALANWFFLIAAIMFYNTASASLKRKIISLPRNISLSDEEDVSGSKMVADGNLLRVFGYLMTALGRERIASSNL